MLIRNLLRTVSSLQISIELSKFFKDGLHFSCKCCGECCRGFNNGEVYLYEEDIFRLVDHLKTLDKKLTIESFCKKYVKKIQTSFYWKPKGATRGKNYSFEVLAFKFFGEDEHCDFLGDDNLCTVHKYRPFQCRAYPIGWNMLINSVRNFRKYSKDCPGLNDSLQNKGKYHSPQEIEEWAKREYEIEKKYFLKMKKNKFDIFKAYPFLPKDFN